MEDNLSIKSSDSVTTSGEYEIVPETPILNIILSKEDSQETMEGKKGFSGMGEMSVETKKGNIPISPVLNIASNGDINDLEKNLTEMIKELDVNDKEGELSSVSKMSFIVLKDNF